MAVEFTMRRLLLICLLSVIMITSPCQAQDVIVLSLTSNGQRLPATVDKGQMVALECSTIFTDQIFPPITYSWHEEGMFTELSTMARYVITADSDIAYQCVASARNLKDRIIRVRGTIDITVRDPPVIASPDQPTVTNDGIEYIIGFNDTCINNTFRGMVNFTCVVVSGRTPLTKGWQVGGEDFTSDGHSMVVTINDTVSKLIIGVDTGASLDLDLNDYRCTATNTDGNDTAVSILSRCETVPVIEEGVTVDECPPSQGNIGGNFSNFTGEQVLINCTLIDSFPVSNISWFHMDTELIMFRNSPEIVITVDNDTIGEYTCVATNTLGSDSVTSFVDIKFPPVINRDLGLMNNISINLYEINVGESPNVEVPYNITNVILYCVVNGRGIPSVNWTTPPLDDNYNITTSVETDRLLYVVTSVFSISNFTNDYAGIYQCNVSNCAGRDSSGINITQQVIYFVGFSSAGYSGREGSTSSISLFVSQPAPFDITLTLQVDEMTATATLDTDYYFIDGSTNPSIPVTIPMGSTTHDVSFTVRSDTIIETDETFGLDILVSAESSSLGVLLSGNNRAIVTLQDDDNFGITVRFTQSSYSAMENTAFVDVELELVGGISADPFSVTITPSEQSPVSAEGGVDFDSTPLTGTFASGSSMSTVRVPVIVDNIVEMTEEFTLTLTVPMLRGITPGSITMATGMIVDTTIVHVQFLQNCFTGTEASGFVLVNLELDGGSSANPFSVTVTPSEQSPVSAEGGGIDFNSDMLTATFASRTIMSNVSVPVSSDMMPEGNEEFDLTLTIPSSVGRGIELGSISTAVGAIVKSTKCRIRRRDIAVKVQVGDMLTRYTFSAGHPCVTYQCKFDDESFVNCTSPMTRRTAALSLGGVRHQFTVVAKCDNNDSSARRKTRYRVRS